MKFKLDLHVHTTRSKDAWTRPERIEQLARQAGLDGVAVTDHNVLSSMNSEKVLIVPGIEVSSRDGHIIGLGVSSEIPRGLSGDETIDRIREKGGLSIIAHPYDFLRPSLDPENLTVEPTAIEVINSASFLHSITWKRARRFADRRGLPATGGSDSHIPETLGRAFTIIEARNLELPTVLEAIRKGATQPEGRPVLLSQRIRKVIR